MRRALRRHWRGERPLGRAFVFGFALPALLLGGADQYAFAALAASAAPFAAVSAYLTVRAGFYLWQTIGLLRAGDRHLAAGGERIWVVGTHGAVLFGAVLLLLAASAGYQTAFERRSSPPATVVPPPGYRFSVSADGATVALRGAIDLGVTAAAAALLETRPSIRTLVLESRGGNVFAARGLARLVRHRRLDTVVISYCESACVIVFIDGRQRTLSDRGRLGFHQYRLQSRTPLLQSDVQSEQNKDLRRFAERGVDRRFLDRLFRRPSTEMWYPDGSELLAAGVADRIRPHDELRRRLRWPP